MSRRAQATSIPPSILCGNSYPRGAGEVWIDAESGIGDGDAGRAEGRNHRKDFVVICDKTSSPARVRYKLVLGPAQLPGILEAQMAAVQKTVNVSKSTIVLTWVGIFAVIAIVLFALAYSSYTSPEGIAPPEMYDNGVFSPYQG